MPGLLTEPLRVEYRWSRASVGLATSVNMVAYGLVAPFTAAWMDRFGLRRVALVALLSVAVGATLTTLMSQAWQITLYWGLLVGAGTGSLSMTFAATVAQRWFMERHGLVVGALTAVLSAVLAASVLGAGRPGPGHGGDGGGDPGVEGGGVLTGGVGTGRTVGVRGTDRLGSGRAGRSGRGHLGCVRGRVAVVRAAPGARVVRACQGTFAPEGSEERRSVRPHAAERGDCANGPRVAAVDSGAADRVYGPWGSREWVFSAVVVTGWLRGRKAPKDTGSGR